MLVCLANPIQRRFRVWLVGAAGLAVGVSSAVGQVTGGEQTGSTSTIHVARYRGNLKAAVSFTFDDGNRNNIEQAVPVLNEFGYRGTFFLIVGTVPAEPVAADGQPSKTASWPEWKKAAEQGHEIANHGMSHTPLPSVNDPDKLRQEINGAADVIQTNIGMAPVSFA